VDSVLLTVNGRSYRGWTSVRITRGIEAIAGSFDLAVSERWSSQATPWPIVDGDACEVSVEDAPPLITGYIDTRGHSFDATQHGLSAGGRDATGDLVDCSAVLSTWEFANITVPELCAKVAAPFGITVSIQQGLTLSTRVTKLVVNPGDTAFEVIDRACRFIGVLPVSDGRGGLQLTRPDRLARTNTAIVEGENVLAADVQYDSSRRYRTYIVSGQSQGSDELNGASAAAVRATATDETVARAGRVLYIRPEGVVTLASARARAEWEATVRAGRAAKFNVTVQGWRQRDGSLWPFNAMVPVRIPTLGVDTELLITETTFGLSNDEGTTTRFTLMAREAFLPEPVIKKKKEVAGTAPNFLGG
jgi:prophage tail gpP-like protein